ncbi:nucleotidyltransferase domain-containing protein [Tepidicaulis sp. LMO-SS28]|uniref:nucleotidyltransferase domain-containing protein n=1 Tax=Tepidicaulis sp. LMO-SS28 TaxID=3447455 RepID=UPI003EE34AF2
MAYESMYSGWHLEDLLLELATAIELSPNDRKIAESRYRTLKHHLERPGSPLASYLSDEEAAIYAQGSMAIGTTVLAGTNDDRFDLDALVEMRVPALWSPDDVLDTLQDALKGFPGTRKIVRCSRCVQLQFAFMHMDVTVMDPYDVPRLPRAGDIFHSPDSGASYRVPANPWAFAQWYKDQCEGMTVQFSEALSLARMRSAVDRLYRDDVEFFADAWQEDLPDIVPPAMDSLLTVALKLLKRFINIYYEKLTIKRPPSIFLTKLSVDSQMQGLSLPGQLKQIARHIYSVMGSSLQNEALPDEENPYYPQDKLNDRWPQNLADKQALYNAMRYLCDMLESLDNKPLHEIQETLEALFGERVARSSVVSFSDRLDRKNRLATPAYVKGVGSILPANVAGAESFKSVRTIPSHQFHAREGNRELLQKIDSFAQSVQWNEKKP